MPVSISYLKDYWMDRKYSVTLSQIKRLLKRQIAFSEINGTGKEEIIAYLKI